MMQFFLFFLLICVSLGFCELDTLIVNLEEFEQQILKRSPILQEKKIAIDKSKLVKSKIHAGFWIKKLQLRLLGGPVPALIVEQEKSFILDENDNKTTSYLPENSNRFNYRRWAIYYGFDAEFVQPLNFFRYYRGLNAASKNIKIKRAKFKKEQNKVSVQAQEIYYGLLLSKKLLKEAIEATRRLDKAQEQLEDDLDEDKEGVSQDDLLEIIASRYRLDKSTNEIQRSYDYALHAAYVLLNFDETDHLVLKDRYLEKSKIQVSPYKHLKRKLLKFHPDLHALKYGLSARQDLVNIAQGEQFFDFFIFAKGTISRTIGVSDVQKDNPFFIDNPFDKTTGIIGIGAQIDLGFWRTYEKVRYEKVELQLLKRKEVYAGRGLVFILNEAYLKYQEAKKNLQSAKKSFKARQSLLKSIVFNTLDDVNVSKLIGPYSRNLEAKRDYYQAIFDYNISIAILIREVGLSLSDIQDKI